MFGRIMKVVYTLNWFQMAGLLTQSFAVNSSIEYMEFLKLNNLL